MQTTTPIQTTPTTPDDLQERSRELLLRSLVGVETLLDGGRRKAAASALRYLLRRSSDEVAREIIERATLVELARELDWEPPQRMDVRFVPATPVERRHVEPRLLTRDELAKDRASRAGDAAAAVYLAEQQPAPIDDKTGWDQPVWGNIDYDLAALYDLRGAPCLGCHLERTRADLRNPDGLCVDCRETSGLTRESVIQRDCAAVAERNTGEQAAELLRAAWKKAGRAADKAVIAAWVAEHKDLLAASPAS